MKIASNSIGGGDFTETDETINMSYHNPTSGIDIKEDVIISLVESPIDDAKELAAKIANLFFDSGGGWAASSGLHGALDLVIDGYFEMIAPPEEG
jgi:hypothetical protein